MVSRSAAQQAAKDAEDARRADLVARGLDPDAPENQPGAQPVEEEQPAPVQAPPHQGSWAALTDASTGDMTLVDASAITHINPGHGSRPNPNPKLQTTHGNVMGPITEIGTIGGLVIRVLEDVRQVAGLIGIAL